MSPRRNVVVAAAVLALAGAGWLAWRASEIPARAAVAASSTAAAPTPSHAVSEPTPRARLAAARAQLRGAAAGGCSLRLAGWSTRAASEASEVEENDAMKRAPGYDAFRASIARIDDALRSSADPYGRAVAIWLNLPRREGDEAAVSPDERTRQLVALANASDDPRIYSLAFPVCRRTQDSSCYTLSARRWAQADVGNAEPWAWLLDDAIRADDLSGLEEALFHIAQSTRADQRSERPVAAILQAAGEDGDATAVYAMYTLSVGIFASQFEPIWSVSSRCRAPAPVDANRAQLCGKVADVMFEHSDGGEGRLVGAHLTWAMTGDSARTDQYKAESGLVLALFKDAVPGSCDQLRERNHWIREMALHGWRAATRAMAASAPASSVSPPSPARTPARTADPASSRS